MADTVREEILEILEEVFDGEVKDEDGYAVRQIFDWVTLTKTYSAVSSLIGELDKEGVIVRDMPSKKRTTRVAIAEKSSWPARKSLAVILEHTMPQMVSMLRPQIQAAIDAEIAMGLAEQAETAQEEATAEAREQAAAIIEEAEQTKRDALVKLARATEKLEQAQQALREAEDNKEQLRIAQHNAEVWKERALGNRGFQETMATVRQRMDPRTARELDRIMRELPSDRSV